MFNGVVLKMFSSKKEKYQGDWLINNWDSDAEVKPFKIGSGRSGEFFFTIRKTDNPKAYFNVTIIGNDLTSSGTQADVEISIISKTGTNVTRARRIQVSSFCPSDNIYMGILASSVKQYVNAKGQLHLSYDMRVISTDVSKIPQFSFNPLDTDYLNKYGPHPVPVISPEKPPSNAPAASPRRLLLDVNDEGRIDCGVTGITTSDGVDGSFVPAVLQMLYNIPYIRKIILSIKEVNDQCLILKEIQKVFAVLVDSEKSVICDTVINHLPWKLEGHSPIDLFSEIIQLLAKVHGSQIFSKIIPTFILNNREAVTMDEAIALTSPPNVYPDILPMWPLKQRSKIPFKFTEKITIGQEVNYVLHEIYIQEKNQNILYVKPSIDGDWIEIKDLNITRANSKQVFEGNFNKKLLCLVYVKENSHVEMFDNSVDCAFDKQLKELGLTQMHAILEEKYTESMKRRTTEFIFFTEETLRFLARTNRKGFQAFETVGRVMLDISASTTQIYFDVAEACGMNVDGIRLWLITQENELIQVPMRNDSSFVNVPTRKLFVQTKKVLDVLDVPEGYKMLFVKYFDPTETRQIMTYIGSVVLSPDLPFSTFAKATAQALGFKPDTPLIAFNEKTLSPMNPNSFISAQPIESSEVIVFQADPSKCFPIPKVSEINFKCLDCRTNLPRPQAAEATPINPLRLLGLLSDVQTYKEYSLELQTNLQVKTFNYNDYRLSPILLSIPDMIHLSQIETAVIKIAKLRFNKNNDVMLFFASDPAAGGIPMRRPLSMSQPLKLNMLDANNPILFYMHEKNPPETRDYLHSRTIHVKIAPDAVNVTEQYSFFANPDSTVEDVFYMLEKRGKKISGNIRTFAETSGTLTKAYESPSEKISNADHTSLRIDVANPSDQEKTLIQVNFAKLDSKLYAHTEGNPFFISFDTSDTIGSIRERIAQLTKNVMILNSNVRFALGKPGMKILPDAILDDSVKLRAKIEEKNCNINDIVILCIKPQQYKE